MESNLERLLPGLEADDVARLSRLPCTHGATGLVRLPGGITNRNYKVFTPHGTFVVRLSDEESALLEIDRVNEHRNSLAAAFAGAGAPVIDFLAGEGVLVVGFLEGRAFTSEDVREESNLPRIADVCRRLHAGPRFAADFNMFEIQSRYLALCQERGFRLPDRYLDFLPHVARMRAAMAIHAEPAVPCNNDLLAANFIDSGDRLWIIDYEYSGNNEASFELGNIWSESTLPAEMLDPLVGAYWGDEDPALVARARLWGLMSKYGWTLWASIQASVSRIDFDFWSWGMEKYDRAVSEFTGADFDDLLDAVARH